MQLRMDPFHKDFLNVDHDISDYVQGDCKVVQTNNPEPLLFIIITTVKHF